MIIRQRYYGAVTLPVPGLTCKAGQEEPQAETNKGVDRSNDP